MSTPTARVWDRVTWCHRVDQDHPDRLGGVMTVCGILVPWSGTRLGVSSKVDCRRCFDEVRWQMGEQGRPS